MLPPTTHSLSFAGPARRHWRQGGPPFQEVSGMRTGPVLSLEAGLGFWAQSRGA